MCSTSTQGLWFVVPIVLSWATSVATPQTRYSSGILAVMHSAQYLWITQYFARREQGASWRTSAYWASVVIGGLALFLPVPWLASYAAHVDFTASVLIVTAVVNLHHFMIDGVVWKLRDPRVSRALTAATEGAAAPPAPARAPAWRGAAIGVAAIALVLLAGVDQWRYRLALRESDPAALAAAARVNPYDSVVQGRLLRTLVERGDEAALRAHLEATIARNPGDVDALVNAGVLAKQQARPATRSGIGPTPCSRIPASATCTSTWPSFSTSRIGRPMPPGTTAPIWSGWCNRGDGPRRIRRR